MSLYWEQVTLTFDLVTLGKVKVKVDILPITSYCPSFTVSEESRWPDNVKISNVTLTFDLVSIFKVKVNDDQWYKVPCKYLL